MRKFIISVACACLAIISINANAAIVSVDWKTAGDNLITRVTDETGSGLEWLDVTATSDRSYNDVSAKLGAGQEFEGWRFATGVEIAGFFDAFGGDSNYYSGFSTQNEGLFDAVAPFWGDLYCEWTGCQVGEGSVAFIQADKVDDLQQWHGAINGGGETMPGHDLVYINFDELFNTYNAPTLGSALVRETVIPVPSAVWLFGSGLIGLIGVASSKANA